MNAEEIKQLQQMVQELNKKIDRHEWRLVDVEKRLNHTYSIDDDMQQAPLADEQEYKEPILKKADRRIERPKKSSSVSATRNNMRSKTFVIGALALVTIGCYFLYQSF